MEPSIEEALVATLPDLSVDKQQTVLDFATFLASKEKRPGKSLRQR